MLLMGMLDSAYWTSWFINNVVVNTLMTFILIIFGCLFQVKNGERLSGVCLFVY
jgi:hypothetical protein